MSRRLTKISALLTALIICVTICLPAASADTLETSQDGSIIYVDSASDLDALAKRCTLDSWSHGKTVELTKDVSLTGKSFTPIPTFGGTFKGNGHTISGLRISGGSTRGFFRVIQSGGSVENLTVQGTVSTDGAYSSLGGVAGQNLGSISSCSFSGIVRGSGEIGGIAGTNEYSGVISACTSNGVVTGEHSTGGIAGENLGTIKDCTNSSSVNTSVEDVSFSIDDIENINWTQINSTDNLSARTDSGGIVGRSTGIVTGCTNYGTIGYQHLGYNVGGIAGRQSGLLTSCVNEGEVLGRKDVGGILGQMEPNTVVEFTDSMLDKLDTELGKLNSLIDAAISDGHIDNSTLSSQMDVISDRVSSALDAADKLGDMTTDQIDSTVDSANAMLDKLDYAINGSTDILDTLDSALSEIPSATDKMDSALANLKEVISETGDVVDSAQDAFDDFSSAASSFISAKSKLESGISALKTAIKNQDLDGAKAAIETIKSSAAKLSSAIKSLRRALDALSDAMDEMGDLNKPSNGAIDDMRAALKSLTKSVDALDTAVSQLSTLADELSSMTVSLPGISSDYRQAGDDLYSSMEGISSAFSSLKDSLSGTVSGTLSHISAINDELLSISGILTDKDSYTTGDVIEDVSDENGSSSLGSVSSCRNNGSVSGDINIGGIAGSMAIEYDYDPEDDLSDATSLTFRYLTSAVLSYCVNDGAVTAKKNYAGGITGLSGTGRVYSCENGGRIESTDGSYVGGIAGSSETTLRSCYAACILSGSDYVGGIAGSGTNITGCFAMLHIDSAVDHIGSIAGEAGGTVYGNYFVDGGEAGIDGISYSGKAEPLDHQTLVDSYDVPDSFRTITLRFKVDGEETATVEVPYGSAVTEVPKIPDRSGFYSTWGDYDFSYATYSAILEAEYNDWVTAISSNTCRPGEKFPVLLAEGKFDGNASLACSFTGDGGAESLALTIDYDGYTPDSPVLLHYRLPDGGSYKLWQKTDSGWEQLDYTMDGKSAVFEFSGESATLRLTKKAPVKQIATAVAIASGTLLLLAFIWFILIPWIASRDLRAVVHGLGKRLILLKDIIVKLIHIMKSSGDDDEK